MQPSPISHTAFFGDGQRTFLLRTPQAIELERLSGVAIGALYNRMTNKDFRLTDIASTIRLGLIGGGCDPEEAAALIDAYVVDAPLLPNVVLAVEILHALMYGNREVSADA